jgi:hypothetical protein
MFSSNSLSTIILLLLNYGIYVYGICSCSIPCFRRHRLQCDENSTNQISGSNNENEPKQELTAAETETEKDTKQRLPVKMILNTTQLKAIGISHNNHSLLSNTFIKKTNNCGALRLASDSEVQSILAEERAVLEALDECVDEKCKNEMYKQLMNSNPNFNKLISLIFSSASSPQSGLNNSK